MRRKDIPLELDTTLNLKVNSVLKAEFEKLCKAHHSNVSSQLKIFMTRAVLSQNLDPSKFHFLE